MLALLRVDGVLAMLPLVLGAVLLLACLLLWVAGAGVVRPGPTRALRAEDLPRAGLVVPVAGGSPAVSRAAASVLAQDYPSFEVVFVTRNPQDPAAGLIREAVEGLAHARLVFAGPANRCGQKNHNLLRGLEALTDRPEILVFCDGTRTAPPGWLRSLVAPLVEGRLEVTSGYHHVLPADARLPTLGHAFSVLVLYLTRGVPFLNQPWGGGTAIRRRTFERLGVRKVWAGNVVDDVSLAALLKRNDVRVGASPGAWVLTPLAGETLGSLTRWLFRQWFYLKVCLPGSWLAAGAACHLVSISLLGALVGAGSGTAGLIPTAWTLFSWFLLCLGGAFAVAARSLLPGPVPLIPWLGAVPVTAAAASWAHLQTLFTMKVEWKGIRYRVRWAGTVAGVEGQMSGSAKASGEH
jgi:cellulose synthase/poly-beta-1,6-N-acetylglucosamine synthase-like glycosyltransferase